MRHVRLFVTEMHSLLVFTILCRCVFIIFLRFAAAYIGTREITMRMNNAVVVLFVISDYVLMQLVLHVTIRFLYSSIIYAHGAYVFIIYERGND